MLDALLQGKTSAVQLMFTGCGSTCPLQGALFAQAQRTRARLPADAQFLSLSIDPLSDGPLALAAWLKKFGAGPGWLAAAPQPEQVERLVRALGDGGERRPTGPDPHTGQVYVVDRHGLLVYRTVSMPPAARVVAILNTVSQRG